MEFASSVGVQPSLNRSDDRTLMPEFDWYAKGNRAKGNPELRIYARQ